MWPSKRGEDNGRYRQTFLLHSRILRAEIKLCGASLKPPGRFPGATEAASGGLSLNEGDVRNDTTALMCETVEMMK